MTIEERSADILKFHKMDSKNLFEMKNLLDEYVSLFKDNYEAQMVFLDPRVSSCYLDGYITPNHFISYLRLAVNYGNKMNLSNEDFLNDVRLFFELIRNCFHKFRYPGGTTTIQLTDSMLLNQCYKLYIGVQPYEHIPKLFRELIVISVYKNILSLGYGTKEKYTFYDELYYFYSSILSDEYISEFIKLNNITDNTIYDCDTNQLFEFIDDYIKNKIKGNNNVITK